MSITAHSIGARDFPEAIPYLDRSITEFSYTNGITSLGDYSFAGCTKLKKCLLPPSLTEIGACAFLRTSLREISIPHALKRIGLQAFSSCDYLRTVKIPHIQANSVKCMPNFPWGLHPSALIYCKDGTLCTDGSYFGVYADQIYEEDRTLTFTADLDDEEAVEDVSNMTDRLDVPDNTHTRLIFQSPIQVITNEWGYVFNRVDRTDLSPGLQTIGENAFKGFPLLDNLWIPSTVTAIGKNAFANCPRLTTVVFPHLTSSALKTLNNFPWGAGKQTVFYCNDRPVKADGKYAPFYCVAFGETEINEEQFAYGTDGYLGDGVSISIPPTVQTIGARAFSNETNTKTHYIANIFMPASIRTIDEKAFLKAFTESPTCAGVRDFFVPSSLTTLGAFAFATDALSVESLILPRHLKTFSTGAFMNVSSNQEVQFDDLFCESVEAGAFGSFVWTETKIPYYSTFKWDYRFSNNGRMNGYSSPHFKNSLNTLDVHSFTHLESIHLDGVLQTVTTNPLFVGEPIFSCEYPVLTVGEMTRAQVMTSAWRNLLTTDACKEFMIHCKDGDCSSSFSTGEADTLIVPEGTTVIPLGYAQFNPFIKSVILPNTVVEIEPYAFASCSSLESINLPESLEAIGDHAFEDCPKLESLTILRKVNRIGENAFYGTALSEIWWESQSQNYVRNIIDQMGETQGCTTYYSSTRNSWFPWGICKKGLAIQCAIYCFDAILYVKATVSKPTYTITSVHQGTHNYMIEDATILEDIRSYRRNHTKNQTVSYIYNTYVSTGRIQEI